MNKVLSIDLACSTKNLGIALVETQEGSTTVVSFLRPLCLGLSDPLDPTRSAEQTVDFCQLRGIRVLVIDGPQGWKDPDTEPRHCRVCERELNTPAKTGVLGIVKPAGWKRFVGFSVDFFTALVAQGATLVKDPIIVVPQTGLLVVESFPFSAWRALGMVPLPSKRKHKTSDITDRAERLKRVYKLSLDSEPNHDELQALVASLAGLALLRGDSAGYAVHGRPPQFKNGITLEGYIVNPRLGKAGIVASGQ